MFDCNVFNEYTDIVSLRYYVSIVHFLGFLRDLPLMSLNILNILRTVSENGFLFGEKVLLDDSWLIVNKDISNLPKDTLTYKQNNSN